MDFAFYFALWYSGNVAINNCIMSVLWHYAVHCKVERTIIGGHQSKTMNEEQKPDLIKFNNYH